MNCVKRIALMVIRNILLVPFMWCKLCYYAAHVDKYPEITRYKLLKYIVKRANKGGNVTIDGSDTWNGEVSNSGGTLNLTNKLSKTTTSKVKFNQTNGTTNINDSKLVLNTSDSTITGGTINIGTSSELDINNSSENSSAINATGGKFSIRKGSKHTITGGTVAKDAEITVESSAKLGVNGDDANVTLDGTTDTVDGSIELSKGKLYISDDLTKVTDENGNYVQTGGSLTMSNSTL